MEIDGIKRSKSDCIMYLEGQIQALRIVVSITLKALDAIVKDDEFTGKYLAELHKQAIILGPEPKEPMEMAGMESILKSIAPPKIEPSGEQK